MDSAIALGISFIALLLAVYRGLPIVLPLLGALVLMAAVYRRRGVSFQDLGALMRRGVSQSAGVISILLLIGLVVASWLLSGTVPALVYYGLQLIHPRWFLVSAFVLTGVVSALLGTSFGSAGTIGLALMIMARGSGMNEQWAAGAIIAGAYVGDRCSPMSSSAHLVATITETNIYRNLRNMMATSWGPLLLSALIYAIASLFHPLPEADNPLTKQIAIHFSVHPVTLLPAVLLVILTVLRVPVCPTLVVSLGTAIAIALSIQGQSGGTLLKTLLMGLHLPATDPLRNMFQGGGLLSMLKVCSVVVVSTALAGLLAGCGTFAPLERGLSRWSGQRGLFGGTLVAGALTSAFGCTQTIAILLTRQIIYPRYAASHLAHDQLAVDIENSAVVLAPLIPWNIAGLVPATVLLTDASFIPYAVYLYLLPLWNWWFRIPFPDHSSRDRAKNLLKTTLH